MPQARALGLAGDIQSDDELDDAEFEQQSLIELGSHSSPSATTRRQLVAPTTPTSSSTSSSPLCKLFAVVVVVVLYLGAEKRGIKIVEEYVENVDSVHHSQQPDKRESRWQLLKPRVGGDDEKKTSSIPSQSPVTSSPTTSDPTVSPSQSPETSSPSQSPVTSSPTTSEPTVSLSQSQKTGGVQETAEKGGVDDTNKEEDFSSGSRPFWCTWNPSNQGQCQDLLQDKLPTPIKRSRRWLFFGDSTMARLYKLSRIRETFTIRPAHGITQWRLVTGSRCKLNDVFHLPYSKNWTPPDNNVQGPLLYGLTHPWCTDCSGCNSEFSELNVTTNISDVFLDPKHSLGGYIAMEFAQDVEIQTPEFLTTQENLAAYVKKVWNIQIMLHEWGKPICVVSAGIHDASIPNITKEIFVQNVKHLLTNYKRVCESIVWLGNTAPRDDDSGYLQTPALMKSWDMAVREMIAQSNFRPAVLFIDVHNASKVYPHADHIHMSNKWYELLGKFFHAFF